MDSLGIVRLMSAEDENAVLAVRSQAMQIAKAIDIVAGRLGRGGRLIYIGAGTSGRLGVLDASECPPTFRTDPRMVQGIIAGGDVALRRAVEGAEDHPDDGAAAISDADVNESDVVFGIATSGTTPYVHGALSEAFNRGAATVFLTCNPDILPRITPDVVIRPIVGPEIIAGSTRLKAGTATKLVLNMVTTGSMIRLGKVYRNLMVDLRATNTKLQDRAERIICRVCGVERNEAIHLLGECGGHVKTAIIMKVCGIDAVEAGKRLDAAGGRVAVAAGGAIPTSRS